MSATTPKRFWPMLWRAIKVLLGAWAFAVAGTILVSAALLVLGDSESPQFLEHVRYATVGLFVLGIPVMLRWLK